MDLAERKIFGQRLKLARKKAGFTMQTLADQLSPKVSVQAISKYETGKMLPSVDVLIGFSNSLDVSLDYLMSGQVIEIKGIEFRKHSHISAQDRARVEVIITEKLENYFRIEGILELPHTTEDPLGDLASQSIENIQDIEDLSNKLRSQWKLGIYPVLSLFNLLEDKGTIIIEDDLPQHYDQLACDVKLRGNRTDVQVLVISSHTNVENKRFNFARELASRVICSTGNSKISLKNARNRFASAFLMPAEFLVKNVGNQRSQIWPHELIRLKKNYGVPAAVLLERLGQVGILSNSSVDLAFRDYAINWRIEEPVPLKASEGFGYFERPQRFELLVWRGLGEQLIAPIRAAELLNVTLSEIKQGIIGPQG